MNIQYLQKLTLLDYPGKVACTIFTYGCNLRCPFCHNAGLVTQAPGRSISPDELFSFLKKRQGILEGVAVTGGEPLISDGIFDILREIKALGYPVKMDTNGFFPDRLEKALREGLCDYVAMDIKNSPKLYGVTVGVENIDISPVLRSIGLLRASGIEHEFRTTVVRELHTENSLCEAAEMIKGAEKYFIQCFKDSGNTIASGYSAYTEKELQTLLLEVKKVIPTASLRGV